MNSKENIYNSKQICLSFFYGGKNEGFQRFFREVDAPLNSPLDANNYKAK